MARIQGIHIMAHGNKVEAQRIAPDIKQNQRLLIGTGTMYGAGAYAWHANQLPQKSHDRPQVLFEIDDNAIREICRRKDGTSLGFFLIPGPIGSYVSIHVLTISNVW